MLDHRFQPHLRGPATPERDGRTLVFLEVLQETQRHHNSQNQQSTEQALKAKLKKTDQLRMNLESGLRDVEDESLALTKVRARLERLIRKKTGKLDLNERRIQMRSERPEREMVQDMVQVKLLNQNHLLNGFIGKLQRSLRAADQDLARLNECRGILEADLTDKIQAMHVDERALSIDESADHSPDSMQRNSRVMPHSWVESTKDIISEAQHWIRDSSRLRSAIRKLVEDTCRAEHALASELDSALQKKVEESSNLRKGLQGQVSRIWTEVDRARQHRQALCDAITANEGPTNQAKQRYALRKTRPGRELVADEVEAALEKQVSAFAVFDKQMQRKVRAVDAQIAQLEGVAKSLDANAWDKERAIVLDREVALLDGRVAVSQPPSLAPSSNWTGSTCRTATMERIALLEQELESARKERQMMEQALADLREEGDGGVDADGAVDAAAGKA